jgi:iron-sulfur cluster repair protein YtfE (RIC family)
MSDTKIRVRTATTLLKEDHQEVKDLFEDYEEIEEADGQGRESIFEQIKTLLSVHSQIEEEIFYPAVARAQDEEAGDLIKEAREEHRLVMQLLEELSGLTPGEDAFEAKMKVMKENVLHHAEEEQRDIFPVFDGLDRDERDQIAERLQSRRRELLGEI